MVQGVKKDSRVIVSVIVCIKMIVKEISLESKRVVVDLIMSETGNGLTVV